jgi:DNA-binding XRE family transcriptional regulator
MADERPLRTRRVEIGLTQVQLAALVGVNPRSELGELRPSAGLRERIERVLAERACR